MSSPGMRAPYESTGLGASSVPVGLPTATPSRRGLTSLARPLRSAPGWWSSPAPAAEGARTAGRGRPALTGVHAVTLCQADLAGVADGYQTRARMGHAGEWLQKEAVT